MMIGSLADIVLAVWLAAVTVAVWRLRYPRVQTARPLPAPLPVTGWTLLLRDAHGTLLHEVTTQRHAAPEEHCYGGRTFRQAPHQTGETREYQETQA